MDFHSIKPICLAIALWPAATWAAQVVVENAWIEAVPPNMHISNAYAVIKNNNSEAVQLTNVTTPVSDDALLNHSKNTNGAVEMVPIPADGITIPANSTLPMAENGYHITLLNLKSDSRLTATADQNKAIPMTFIFSDGEQIQVNARVQPAAK